MQVKWDLHSLRRAQLELTMSKDPSTQVGAVVIGGDREVLSTGFNGFPRGIKDSVARLSDRELKHKLIVHAEMNTILNAALNGVSLRGGTLYWLARTRNVKGDYGWWGGCPCSRCMAHLIQAGIRRIVSISERYPGSVWDEDMKLAHEMRDEVRIEYEEYPLMEL